MGFKLYREVMRWAPQALTKGEKLAALVLADDALDETRLTWHSVVDPEILRRAMVPDDRAMLRIVAKLKAEKVVEHASGGHNGKVAKYKFLRLEPVDAAPDPLGGGKAHPTDGGGGAEGWQESPPYDGPADEAVQKITTLRGGKGGDFVHGRVVKTTTPTPSTPSTTTPSSSADDATGTSKQQKERRKPAAAGGDVPLPRPDVDAICDHLADVLVKTGSSKPTVTVAWRKAARLLLDKDGITVEQAQRAIDWAHQDDFWTALILTPMKLREKYETLRRKATAERNSGVRKPVATADDWKNETKDTEIDL